VKIISDNAKIT